MRRSPSAWVAERRCLFPSSFPSLQPRGGQAVEPIAERPRDWPRLAGAAAPRAAAGPWQEAAGTGTARRTLSLTLSLPGAADVSRCRRPAPGERREPRR